MDRSSPLVTISSKLLASGVAVSCHSMRACVSFESFLRKDALFASARAGSNGRHGDDAQLDPSHASLARSTRFDFLFVLTRTKAPAHNHSIPKLLLKAKGTCSISCLSMNHTEATTNKQKRFG